MTTFSGSEILSGRGHLAALRSALVQLDREAERLHAWGQRLATVLAGGGRLLVAGNGGSAAQAQHLTSELVGRYRDDRIPLSALALHAESSSYTAICNDYGGEQGFSRQVLAHGRPGDILLALSTSGRSPNVVASIQAASRCSLETWALTGPIPNPVALIADEAFCVDAPAAATVQEVHQVAIHLVCAAVDVTLGVCEPARESAE